VRQEPDLTLEQIQGRLLEQRGQKSGLQSGEIVVPDNLSAHKMPCVRDAIESTGAAQRYLPPYSPDFNPIEQPFAKLKAPTSTSPP